MRKIVAILMLGFLAACSDPKTAQRALDGMGFSDIEVLGWGPFAGCSDKDTFVTKFRAKNAKGHMVSGVVCNGWFKGATVRFD